jgi:hypothetical protein
VSGVDDHAPEDCKKGPDVDAIGTQQVTEVRSGAERIAEVRYLLRRQSCKLQPLDVAKGS